MRGDDVKIWEIGGELIDCGRMRMSDDGAQATGHTGTHAGCADVNHDRHLEFVDRLP